MTKKKSIIGAMLLLVAFAVSAIAGGSSNSADFTITSGNLTEYTGTDTTVYVPADVTTISAGAFNNTAIDVIYLPTTITTVANNAFANCSADVKIIFEMSTPTSALPSGMENWGVANAGGQITTYTTSGITTYTLSDVSAIANTTKYAYIMDGRFSYFIPHDIIEDDGLEEFFTNIETITYTNTISVPSDAEDVSRNGDNTVMVWIVGKDVYVWFDGDKLVMPASMSYYYSGLGIEKITGLNLLDMSNVTSMSYMFLNCTSLETFDFSNADLPNVTSMDYMFSGCESLKTVDFSNADLSKVTSASGMFSGCESLKTVDFSNADLSSLTRTGSIFNGKKSLETVDFSNVDISNVISAISMFAGCESLKTVDFTNTDLSNVTRADYMFSGCVSLETLDLSSFDMSSVTDMSDIFKSCTSLKNVYVKSAAEVSLLQAETTATVTVKP